MGRAPQHPGSKCFIISKPGDAKSMDFDFHGETVVPKFSVMSVLIKIFFQSSELVKIFFMIFCFRKGFAPYSAAFLENQKLYAAAQASIVHMRRSAHARAFSGVRACCCLPLVRLPQGLIFHRVKDDIGSDTKVLSN